MSRIGLPAFHAMPMRKGIVRDRQLFLQLLGILALGLSTLVTCLSLVSPAAASTFVRNAGYWIVLGLFAAVVVQLIIHFPRHLIRRAAWTARVRFHAPGLIAVGLLGSLWHVHEAHLFKIQFDESAYSGVAYNMHQMREASYPARAHFIDGRLRVLERVTDKRPFFFPFLVSLVHDLTGYRVENAFWVNAASGYALLFFLYLLGAALGNRWHGTIAVALIGGSPLLAQCVTSGGYDALNLCLLLATILAAIAYLRRAGNRCLNLFILLLLLLAQVRYESILFVLVAPLIVLIKWRRRRVLRLTWFSMTAPIFLSVPLLVNRVFISNPQYLESGPDRPFFSWSYFSGNLDHALYYLFDPSLTTSNSLFLSLVGTISSFLLLTSALRLRSKGMKKVPLAGKVVIVFAPIILINSSIGLFNFWGAWDDPLVSRFSLPFQTLLVLATVGALATIRIRSHWILSAAASTLVVRSVVCSVPAMTQSVATTEIVTATEYAWLRNELRSFDPDRTLVLAPSCIGPITWGFPSVAISGVAPVLWKLQLALDCHVYDRVLLLQRVRYSPGQTDGELDPRFALPGIELATLRETRTRTDIAARLCEVVRVAPEFRTPPTAVTNAIASKPEKAEAVRLSLELLP